MVPACVRDGVEFQWNRGGNDGPDTDKGGVRDGQEVVCDETNPLDAVDDILERDARAVADGASKDL